ncbi:MAG: tetratricopeptide repeat protein [Kiritimatiellae bacterium]|jgi:tetratricopeptide (TPR) repeat protein|nr:tetratricopeptide repeat protein [Kiritimatiellia bacterium]
MRKVILLFVLIVMTVCVCTPLAVIAEDRQKVKISVLLKDANEIMSEAQNTYVDGDSTKAIELYRKALVEILKIEAKYPNRVTSADFAPLRFRRALCETEVDRIMLEDVNASARSVAVTDTRDLEKRHRERKENAATNKLAKVSKKLSTKGGTGDYRPLPEPKTKTSEKSSLKKPVAKTVNIEEELEWAKDMFSVNKFVEVEKPLILILREKPDHFEARYLMALTRIRQDKLIDAKVVIEDLLDDHGQHEGVLLMAAGLYAMTQQYAKAMTTLDKALKVAPNRPDGYLNMAWLLLEMNPKQLSDPEMYYRRSVELGGKRDHELEKRIGIRQN